MNSEEIMISAGHLTASHRFSNHPANPHTPSRSGKNMWGGMGVDARISTSTDTP